MTRACFAALRDMLAPMPAATPSGVQWDAMFERETEGLTYSAWRHVKPVRAQRSAARAAATGLGRWRGDCARSPAGSEAQTRRVSDPHRPLACAPPRHAVCADAAHARSAARAST